MSKFGNTESLLLGTGRHLRFAQKQFENHLELTPSESNRFLAHHIIYIYIPSATNVNEARSISGKRFCKRQVMT